MKKTHLALMAAVSTSLVSSIGAFCQTRGNTTPPSDADPNATPEEVPTMPRPHIISINPIPIPLPSIVAAVLNNPVMGTQIQATICVSPYPEGGEGQIQIYLNQPLDVYSATITNLSTGHICFINSVSSTYISAQVRRNGIYEIRITTSQGEYIGTIEVNNLSGEQLPCGTIDDGAEGGFSTLPPANRFPHP